ncbi:MAG: SAM-dependent methyltransferase [Cyanobacteria bacterium J055]|nr:MAG: SAM-dependent methyltransferase [Cyanobacteria bacterium J055]
MSTTEIAVRPVTPLGILVEQLENIVKMTDDAAVSKPLATAIKEAYALAAGLDPYLEEATTPDSAPLQALTQKTLEEDWSKLFDDRETVRQLEREMLSGHLEGQALKMFVRMTRAQRILEVGMFTGYSALAMAEALPDDGRLVACEVDDYVSNFARSCFGKSPHGSKIEVKVGPALETLQQLAEAGESFDLVFIDADKTEYVDYFRTLIETDLLAADGFILVDNTLLQGQPYLPVDRQTKNGAAIAQFNRLVAEDPRVEQVLLPVRDGLSIIRRK